MKIDSECLEGTTIPIDGLTFKTQQELNDYINKIHKRYPNLTSKQWQSILFMIMHSLYIGFTDIEKGQ